MDEKRKTYEAHFINPETGEINEMLLESRNIWEVTEFCKSIEIPDHYECFWIFERFEEN